LKGHSFSNLALARNAFSTKGDSSPLQPRLYATPDKLAEITVCRNFCPLSYSFSDPARNIRTTP
jgi:hypothetical protein